MDTVIRILRKSLKKHQKDFRELDTTLKGIKDKESFTFTHLSNKLSLIAATVEAVEGLIKEYEDGKQ